MHAQQPVGKFRGVLEPEQFANVEGVVKRGALVVEHDVVGPGDADLKAIVNDESELAVPDPDMIFPPAKVLPIGKTIHTMYPGCRVAATLNLYSFISGKVPGFSSSASVAVFKNDEERFGGGVSVDEDEIFMD